jgi:exodeoxyribonuclease V alpha subunit
MLRRLLASGGRAALTDSAHDLLAAFDRYRVLAVHRRGPLGVDGLTRALSRRFKQHILESDIARPVTDAGANADAVRATRRRRGLLTQSGLWLGQPVLVTENAYEVNLWNGDIGLVLPSATSARALECVFPATEPSDASAPAPLRRVALSRLPPHADGLVLTVHKSQGSQFNHVALVLADRASPIQTRELVYTGLTRASERVTWLGRADLLQGALGVRVVRGSALALRLGD